MELYHHGVKGQKWGVRRYQNPDGSLTVAGRKRYSANESSGFSMEKTYKFTRYTPSESDDLRPSSYVSVTKSDREIYKNDALNGVLGWNRNDVEYVFTKTIVNTEPIKIKYGESIVKDVVDKSGDQSIKEAYKYLEERGVFTKGLDHIQERQSNNSKLYSQDKTAVLYRKQLAKYVHDVVYENREKFISDYKKEGWDAIIDPEDLIYNYQMPMIVVNEKKFKTIDSTRDTNVFYKGR